MAFLDRPLDHIGAQRTSRNPITYGSPVTVYRTESRWAAWGWAVACILSCAATGALLAWRG